MARGEFAVSSDPSLSVGGGGGPVLRDARRVLKGERRATWGRRRALEGLL